LKRKELLENFLGKTTGQSRNLTRKDLRTEKKNGLISSSSSPNINEEYKIGLQAEVEKKIAVNEAKYRAEKAKRNRKTMRHCSKFYGTQRPA